MKIAKETLQEHPITVHLWESYVGSGAPPNGAGSKTGLGLTRKEAHEAADHWNNQAPFARCRRVILIDGKAECAELAHDAMGYLMDVPLEYASKSERDALRHYRAKRWASAWLALFGSAEKL